jgi:hypothetical protein
MKGWLDNFGKADNANDSNVSLPEGFVGLGYNTKGRNYSPAWEGQFQDGGKLIPVSPMQQITGQASSISPTVPYLKTKDPVEFYQSWIQSPEYARRQLLTGYSPSAEDESLAVPSAAASRQIRLESLQNIDPITYSTRQPSESRPGVYGIPSTVNINPLDYIDTNRGMVEAHELAHIAGAMESEGTTRPGVMSAKEQEIFKKSMLPMKEPVLSGSQGSQQREASRRALEDFEHSKKPKELKADLDALRFTMYDKGIYDITKGKKFTESDFEKAKQTLGKDRVFKRLENRVGKKNFVNLMNTIAKADEEELPLAMGGMSIPGSVGFTYARTAGSAPSKGKYAKKTMASAQKGKKIEKDATNLTASNKIAGLELQTNPEYQYWKYQQSLPQLRKAPGLLEKVLGPADSDLVKTLDVATDVMQLGNFIPERRAQFIGQIGNVVGTAIDAYQAAANVYKGDYKNAGLNAASAVLPSVLGSKSFRRNTMNLRPGDPLYPLTEQARRAANSPINLNKTNLTYLEPFTKVRGMTDKSLMANRALLGILGAETAYDAGAIGPVKKEYGGEIPSAQSGITSPLLMMGKILSYIMPDEEASKSIAIEKKAPTKGLTNELLKRQAYKESTFNPAAVSPAGYKGLTQIGEEVIADYSKKKGGKKLDPFNPQDAVELQKFAMDDLYNASFINKENQSDSVRIAKTLAAYNWGRGNLYDYLGEQKKKGVDIYNSYDWLQDLPKETSDYVNKILLQEDPSFNKNYTRASTNPKYKSVTSLYGSKEFGGDIPSAQNGQEMKFYQNGLDWKPKSMQEGGKIYEGQELPEFVVEGKDDRLKQAMYEGSNRFLQGALGVMGSPQTGLMEVITGKQQTPSQAFGFQNTDGWLDSPLSFGKNLSNFAMDAVLDPVNLIGVGIADDIARTTLKGLSKKGALRQLPSSVDDVSKVFKSEIDWSKWNPETPNYPELINEYNAIEETTKKAGTWMKNPDGSAFEGTPEQFIQQQSSYFKKAYPQGYNEVYRGVSANNSFANLDEGTDLELSGPRGIFTANKELASNYVLGPQAWEENKRILTPFDPDNTAGLFELVYPKGKQIDRYQQLDDWSNVNLGRIPNKENIKYSIDNLKSQLERRKKITEELESTEGMSSIADQAKIEIKIQENRIAKLQKYYDDFDNIVSDEAEFNKMRNALGDKTTTDDIAQYIPKTNLRSVTLRDLIDSGQGDVTIVNNRPGNYLKSKVGNVGFFDLTNPNIYKGVIPAGIATTLSIDQQKNGGITKDNRGYWNPDNWGKPVEIDSNDITMEGVYEPLLGVSDTGDTKLMKPGKNYKFKGKKVTEYPVAKLGINQLDAQPMKKLNQLLNFTNNPDKDNWLDKYN